MTGNASDSKRIIRTQGLLSFQDPPRHRKGNLLIQNGQISAIGGIAGHNDAVISESPYLLMPAFLQLRADLRESFFERHFVASQPHENFRYIQAPQAIQRLETEEKNLSISTGLQQMSACGTSCASHFFSTFEEAKRIANLISNQRFKGLFLLDLDDCNPKQIGSIIEQVTALQSEHRTRVRFALYCRFPRKNLFVTMKKSVQLSYDFNIPLFVETCDLSLSTIQNLLRKADLRSKNISLIPLRLTGIEQLEVARLLSDEKLFVYFSPLFHLLMGESPPDLKAAIDAEVPLAISSMTGATRSQYNIFHELYHVRRWLSPHCNDAAVRTLRMATLTPAKSAGIAAGQLGLDQCADLVAIDVRNTKSTDVNHLADLIIDGGQSQVRSLWINGEPIIIPRSTNHRTVRANTAVLTSLRTKLKHSSSPADSLMLNAKFRTKRLFLRLLGG